MIYSVTMGAVYIESGDRREKQLDILFDAPDDFEAACDAVLWVNDRFEALRGMLGLQYVGAIKLHRFKIGQVNPQGRCDTLVGGQVFEWKYDVGFRSGLQTDCAELVGSRHFNTLLKRCAALRGT